MPNRLNCFLLIENQYFDREKEVKKTKRKRILGMLLLLTLAVTVTISSIGPAIANNNNSKNVTYSFNLGVAQLKLPPAGGAVANHPTDLRIIAYDFTRNNKFFGYPDHDELYVQIWYPPANTYVGVALITDNANPEATDFFKNVFAGGPEAVNVIVVEEEELEVWMDSKIARCGSGEILVAELNMPNAISIILPGPLAPLSFTIPSTMTLTFREIGDEYQIKKGENVQTLSAFPYTSGFTISQYGWEKPVFVQTSIQDWLVGSQDYSVGIIRQRWTSTFIPPA
jgi:hypothetical protein